MKRATAKEIISFWLYMLRKEANLGDYGSSDTDQNGAENIIKFFEDLKNKEKVTIRDWQWEKMYEDYKSFQSIVGEIDEPE